MNRRRQQQRVRLAVPPASKISSITPGAVGVAAPTENVKAPRILCESAEIACQPTMYVPSGISATGARSVFCPATGRPGDRCGVAVGVDETDGVVHSVDVLGERQHDLGRLHGQNRLIRRTRRRQFSVSERCARRDTSVPMAPATAARATSQRRWRAAARSRLSSLRWIYGTTSSEGDEHTEAEHGRDRGDEEPGTGVLRAVLVVRDGGGFTRRRHVDHRTAATVVAGAAVDTAAVAAGVVFGIVVGVVVGRPARWSWRPVRSTTWRAPVLGLGAGVPVGMAIHRISPTSHRWTNGK